MHLHLYIRLVPFDNASVAISLLYFNGRHTDHKLHHGHSSTEAMLLALVHGTELAASFGKDNGVDVNLSIFLPNRTLLPFLFSLKKHRYLHYSTKFTLLLTEFLGDSSSLVRLYGYSTNWSGLPGLELARNAAASPPPLLTLSSQPALTSRKDEAYQSWRNDTMITPRRRSHANISTPPPEGIPSRPSSKASSKHGTAASSVQAFNSPHVTASTQTTHLTSDLTLGMKLPAPAPLQILGVWNCRRVVWK